MKKISNKKNKNYISKHKVNKQTNKQTKPQVTAHAGEDVEKEEHSSIADGIASWYNHSGNQSVGSSEN
jgi:rare lipoprotein A (peptidoglycan hydrolase)